MIFKLKNPLIMKGSQWSEPEEMPWSLTVPLFGTAFLITFGGRGQHCELPPFPPSKCQNMLNCYQRQTVSSGLLRRGRHPGGVGSFQNASVAVTNHLSPSLTVPRGPGAPHTFKPHSDPRRWVSLPPLYG